MQNQEDPTLGSAIGGGGLKTEDNKKGAKRGPIGPNLGPVWPCVHTTKHGRPYSPFCFIFLFFIFYFFLCLGILYYLFIMLFSLGFELNC